MLSPQLAVELVPFHSTVELTRREADIAVRMFRPRPPELIARRVTEFPLAAFAARAYVDRAGTPKTVAALADHGLVGLDTEFDAEALARLAGRPMRRDDFAFRTDSRLAQISALRAGLGIGFMQRRLAAHHGDLVELDLPLALPALPLYLVTHAEMRTSRRMKAVFDHLVAHFEELPPLE